MELRIFGYTLILKKDELRSLKEGGSELISNGCFVTAHNGDILLTDPDGVIIPHQITTVINAPLHACASATIEVLISGIHAHPKEWEPRSTKNIVESGQQ